MNAISLYVSVSRIAFQYNSVAVDQKWTDLYRLLPYLRQALSCAVCGRLLSDPYSTKESKCQHYVCRLCVRGWKNIKPGCNSCKECRDFKTCEENKQIRILLQCYKSLCEHIMDSPLYNLICQQTTIPTGSLTSGVIIPNLSLVEFIEEGANFEDIFIAFATSAPKAHKNYLPTHLTSTTVPSLEIKLENTTNSPPPSPPPLAAMVKDPCLKLSGPTPVPFPLAPPVVRQRPPQKPVNFFNHQHLPQKITASTPVTLIQSPVDSRKSSPSPRHISTSSSSSSSSTTSTILATSSTTSRAPHAMAQIRNPPPIKTVSNGSAMYSVLYTGIGNKITIKRKTDGDDDSTLRKTPMPTAIRQVMKPNSKRRGCRCGNATPTPGKLTCCGQRCPCYVDSKSCIDCKCRGCRNPHRPDGGKVRPIIPELASYEILMVDDSIGTPPLQHDHQLPIMKASSTSSAVTLSKDDFTKSKFTIAPVSTTATSSAAMMPMKKHQQQPVLTFTTAANHQLQREPTTQIVNLENMATESLLIQSSEGKYQVVNVYTTTPHQSGNIQRIHTVPTSVTPGNTIVLQNPMNNRIASNVHQMPEISTTLPQIIMQQPHHHSAQQISSAPITSTASNVITMHPITSSHISPHQQQHLHHPSHSTISLSPIIVASPNSFPEMFTEDYSSTQQQATHPPTMGLAHQTTMMEVVEADHL